MAMITQQIFSDDSGNYELPYEVTRTRKRNYYFPNSASAAIFRNGLLMTPGVDYLLVGNKISPLLEWPSDDIVSIVFEIKD